MAIKIRRRRLQRFELPVQYCCSICEEFALAGRKPVRVKLPLQYIEPFIAGLGAGRGRHQVEQLPFSFDDDNHAWSLGYQMGRYDPPPVWIDAF